MITSEQMRGLLRKKCDKAGSVKGWAKTHGLHWAHIYNVLLGKKDPGEKVLKSLGLERVVGYRKKREDGTEERA